MVKIWHDHGLAPHRWRSFKLSNDKAFAEKLHDVVALYVSPPAQAIALSVDEKSQIQALDRTDIMRKSFKTGSSNITSRCVFCHEVRHDKSGRSGKLVSSGIYSTFQAWKRSRTAWSCDARRHSSSTSSARHSQQASSLAFSILCYLKAGPIFLDNGSQGGYGANWLLHALLRCGGGFLLAAAQPGYVG